jgi:hypothetical protein
MYSSLFLSSCTWKFCIALHFSIFDIESLKWLVMGTSTLISSLLGHRKCPLPGEITPSYVLHTSVFGTYLLGGYLPCKKIIRWWYFICKKHENKICDGILHVNMFHYFRISYFICNFFTKFTYNEYIGPYFLSHVVLRFSPSDLPGVP